MNIDLKKNNLTKILPIIFAILLTGCGGDSAEETLKQENLKLTAKVKELQSLLNKSEQATQGNSELITKKLADVQSVLRKKNKVIQEKNKQLKELNERCPE